MLEGVTISESKAQKDELILEGNDIDNVSQSGESCLRFRSEPSLTPCKLPPFRVAAVFVTKISVNSWTVSMCQTKSWLSKMTELLWLLLWYVCPSLLPPAPIKNSFADTIIIGYLEPSFRWHKILIAKDVWKLRDEWNFCPNLPTIFNIILSEKLHESAFFNYNT